MTYIPNILCQENITNGHCGPLSAAVRRDGRHTLLTQLRSISADVYLSGRD
jgi:hypothetical protein